jgi:hypothetical protein
VTVTIRDLLPAFLEFWDGDRSWEEYVDRHPEVLNDLTRSGRSLDPERVAKALTTYQEQEGRIRANAPHAAHWIDRAAGLVVPLLDAHHIDIDAVAMVGLATSNGWVADGTLYLAVETIPDERSAEILAAHEIAHALQLPLPEQPWPDDKPLGQTVYSEGFATALTAELYPQYSLAEHLWFGNGYDDWLADCRRHEPAVRAELLANLDSEDDQVLRRFLMVTDDESPFPSRIGYFVGTRILQELRRDHSWPELARWSTERAMDEVRNHLSGNAPDDLEVPA